MPFRETHHISGAAVKLAEDKGCTLSDLTVEDLAGINPLFTEDVTSVGNTDNWAMAAFWRAAAMDVHEPTASCLPCIVQPPAYEAPCWGLLCQSVSHSSCICLAVADPLPSTCFCGNAETVLLAGVGLQQVSRNAGHRGRRLKTVSAAAGGEVERPPGIISIANWPSIIGVCRRCQASFLRFTSQELWITIHISIGLQLQKVPGWYDTPRSCARAS